MMHVDLVLRLFLLPFYDALRSAATPPGGRAPIAQWPQAAPRWERPLELFFLWGFSDSPALEIGCKMSLPVSQVMCLKELKKRKCNVIHPAGSPSRSGSFLL